MKNKYEKIIHLSTQLLRLETFHGSTRWKVTDLARSSRISRSRIYELLGTNKKEMLKNALKALLEEIYGLSPERTEFNRTHTHLEGVMKSRNLVIHSPELLSFYFRARERTDEIGEIIREYEKKYYESVRQRTGIRNPAQLLFVRSIIHGISVAPFLEEEDVAACMNQLTAMIQSGQFS